LVIGSWFLLTVAFPAVVRRVYVKPNELQLEAPYIERSIALTQEAYNLHKITVKPFPAEQGLTAQSLLRRTYRVKRGDVVLIHAAAGGVGLLMTQWAKHLGARVIAVVGSTDKAQLVRDHGADLVLLSDDDWVRASRDYTRSQGVAVVYDSVGKDTFMRSLDCLRPLGMMVTFGNASGPVPPVAPLELSKRGSLFLTRPTLFHYTATRAMLTKAAQELFAVVAQGAVRVHIGQTYALRDAAQAHRDLEARKTVGSTVLVV